MISAERFRTEDERAKEVEIARLVRRAETLLRLRALDQRIAQLRAEIDYQETVRSELEVEVQIYDGADAAATFAAAGGRLS